MLTFKRITPGLLRRLSLAFAVCVWAGATTACSTTGDNSWSDDSNQTVVEEHGIDSAEPVGTPIAELGDNAVVNFPYDIPRAGSKYSPNIRKAEEVAKYLKENKGVSIRIEGHCDPRGTQDYNMALGARRATSFKEQIVAQGVEASRISIVSYGKQRPACSEKSEACWSKDRRAIVVAG